MKAVINSPLAVKAAANVANGGYRLSFFQVRRVGDMAEISGTNGYVVVIATVPATFTRWNDGKSMVLSGDETRSMMRGVGNAIKSAQQVAFERTAQEVTISTVGSSATVSTSFAIDLLQFPHSAATFKDGYSWEGCVERIGGIGEATTATAIDPYMIATACNAIKALELRKGYRMMLRGEYGAIEFDMSDDDCRVQAIVMPIRDVA